MGDKNPLTKGRKDIAAARSSSRAVDAFLRQAKALRPADGDGRLLFGLDATMSRQPTWDMACDLQAEMFQVADASNALNIQLIYFRGFGECKASRWVKDSADLRDLMTRIDCRGGNTQIGKVLSHARKQAKAGGVSAVVFIGDAMEENPDMLCQTAGELGLLGVPCFMFQEGRDLRAETTFKEIARLSKGAWFRFDKSSASQLRRLLGAVAAFASGGVAALERRGGAEEKLLLSRLSSPGA